MGLAYLDGVQDNLLDFRDRTRLAGQARAYDRAVCRKVPPKLQPESTARLDDMSIVRGSWRNVYPARRPAEAVHRREVGGSEMVSRGEVR